MRQLSPELIAALEHNADECLARGHWATAVALQFIAAAQRIGGEDEVARLCASFEGFVEEYRTPHVVGKDGNVTYIRSALQ